MSINCLQAEVIPLSSCPVLKLTFDNFLTEADKQYFRDYKNYVKVDEKFLRPEELHNLKGDSSKLKSITGWLPNYTFESMLDEMLEYWINYYNKNK